MYNGGITNAKGKHNEDRNNRLADCTVRTGHGRGSDAADCGSGLLPIQPVQANQQAQAEVIGLTTAAYLLQYTLTTTVLLKGDKDGIARIGCDCCGHLRRLAGESVMSIITITTAAVLLWIAVSH